MKHGNSEEVEKKKPLVEIKLESLWRLAMPTFLKWFVGVILIVGVIRWFGEFGFPSMMTIFVVLFSAFVVGAVAAGAHVVLMIPTHHSKDDAK